MPVQAPPTGRGCGLNTSERRSSRHAEQVPALASESAAVAFQCEGRSARTSRRFDCREAGLAGHWRVTARDVLLIIEVADSSLPYDRDVKIPQYAESGIPEAWLVDVNAERISVYRDPGPQGYRKVAEFSRGETLRPMRLPATEITTEEILG